MSFILDALKKSETERQRQSGPALFEVKVAPPRSRVAPWAVGLVLLLVLNLIVLGWVALRDRAPAADSTPSAPTATPQPAARPPAALQAVSPAAAPRLLPDGGAAAIPSTAPPLLEEPVLDEMESSEFTPPPAPPAASVGVTPLNMPTREELVARGTPVPELRLDLHVYGARPDERFVFVNMRRLHEGESTADGLRIEHITPDGAILSWQGKRFHLPKE